MERHIRNSMQLKLSTKAFILVALPLACEVIFVSVLMYTQGQLEDAYKREIHAREVSDTINSGLASVLKSVGYLVMEKVANDSSFEDKSQKYFHDLDRIKNELLTLEANGKYERARINELAELVEQLISEYNNVSKAQGNNRTLALLSMQMRGNELIDSAEYFMKHQSEIKKRESIRQDELTILLNRIVVSGIGLNFILALILVQIFNRNTSRRLDIVRKNSGLLALNQELLPRIDGEDEIAQIDGHFHDMAEAIIEATKREKAILANTADVIFTLDENLAFTFVSPAAQSIWGYSADEILGQDIDVILFKQHINRVRELLLKLELSKQRETIECTIVTASQTELESLFSAYWASQERQLFCVSHDITERKRLERMKQEITSMVSHDLKSPLSSLNLTFGLLVDEDGISEEGALLCRSGKESVDRMIGLINDLLDTERLEKGLVIIEKKSCKSRSLVAKAIESVMPLANRRGIQFKILGPNVEIACDEERILQVLVNLLSNAIKFSPEVSLIKVVSIDEGESIRLEVVDQGPGIPEHRKTDIFNRFSQLSIEDARERGGTGLGLAIAKWLVEAHEGSIGVDSPEAGGSTFWFSLPK